MSEIAVEPGSFRDRTARVFYHDGHILRGLTDTALKDWQALSASNFYRRFSTSGALVPTRQRDSASLPFSSEPHGPAVLEHERLPFVSYPYEWSFEMLRDAALLQLDLVLAGLDEGIGLKDASAYNVQWKGATPVFVDIASFYRRGEGEPWVGYRQFCQMFLYPLLLQAYRDVPFQPWMRGNIDGMDAEVCLNLLSARDYLRAGVLAHVYLQAKAQKAYNRTTRDVRADLSKAGFDKRIISANAERLRALVAGLRWKPKQSTWSEYLNVVITRRRTPRRSAISCAMWPRRRDWPLVWDIGCNVGVFSRIVAERAKYVVAMDADHLAIDKLYRALKSERVTNILPLVVNVTDPSPNLGWRNLERKRHQRARPARSRARARADSPRRHRRQHSARRIHRMAARSGRRSGDRVRHTAGPDGHDAAPQQGRSLRGLHGGESSSASCRRDSESSDASRSARAPASCTTPPDDHELLTPRKRNGVSWCHLHTLDDIAVAASRISSDRADSCADSRALPNADSQSDELGAGRRGIQSAESVKRRRRRCLAYDASSSPGRAAEYWRAAASAAAIDSNCGSSEKCAWRGGVDARSAAPPPRMPGPACSTYAALPARNVMT